MRIIKLTLTISVVLNIVLISILIIKNNSIDDAISRLTSRIQGDLVELESAISYQSQNNWIDGNNVLEKLEDIQQEISSILMLGQEINGLSKAQKEELYALSNFMLKYPTYRGYPNTNLSSNDIDLLENLQKDLREVGWGMNIGYTGSWESFSKKLNKLIYKEYSE